MKFVNPLPFVRDIEASKRFYGEVLGLSVREDHGDIVLFEDGFAIHDGAALYGAVFGRPDPKAAPYGRDNLVLYFEVPDLDAAFERLAEAVTLIHGIRQEPWGGRVFRFYDPDGHVIEVGTPRAG